MQSSQKEEQKTCMHLSASLRLCGEILKICQVEKKAIIIFPIGIGLSIQKSVFITEKFIGSKFFLTFSVFSIPLKIWLGSHLFFQILRKLFRNFLHNQGFIWWRASMGISCMLARQNGWNTGYDPIFQSQGCWPRKPLQWCRRSRTLNISSRIRK